MLPTSTTLIQKSDEILLVNSEEKNEVYIVDPITSNIIFTFSDAVPIMKNTLKVSPRYGQLIGCQKAKTIFNYWSFGKAQTILKSFYPEKIICCDFTKTEEFFLAGTVNGIIYLWQNIEGSLLEKFKAHQKAITCLQILDEDIGFVTGSEEGTIKLWLFGNIFDKSAIWKQQNQLIQTQFEIQPTNTYIGHTDKITDLKLSKLNDNLLFSSSNDKLIIIWELTQGQKLQQIQVESQINCLILVYFLNVLQFYNQNGYETNIYCGCKDNNIYCSQIIKEQNSFQLEDQNKQIQLKKNPVKHIMTGHNNEITSFAYIYQNFVLISGDMDGLILFWNQSNEILKKLTIFKTEISNLVCVPRPEIMEQQSKNLIQQKKLFSVSTFSKLFKKLSQIFQQKYNLKE